MSETFRHVESARTIVFGPAALASSAELIGEGYTLLSTTRAAASAPEVLRRAATMIEVPAGPVDVVSAQLRAMVTGSRLVALGGGRVIDVAKALAAADPPRDVVTIPTSLSAAEMTAVHRHAQGVAPDTPHARPVVVINDPRLSASQPADALAASSANALGHAITALVSDRATPISQAVARDGIERLVGGWADAEPDRPALALGALLGGWAVDHSGLGLHHALAQTAVLTASLEHAQTNAALLPATIRAIRSRRPAEFKRLDQIRASRWRRWQSNCASAPERASASWPTTSSCCTGRSKRRRSGRSSTGSRRRQTTARSARSIAPARRHPDPERDTPSCTP
jgi:maleylacetate reductase